MLHTIPDRNLGTIKEKINEIKTALFKTELDTDLQLPNNIIQTLKVENDGTVWFFTAFNGSHRQDMDKTFYAYLDYYKKGSGCNLQLSGKANIVKNDDDGLFSICNYPKGSYGRLVLVKMKIMQAEISENKIADNASWAEKLIYNFSQLFEHPAHRTYHFSD